MKFRWPRNFGHIITNVCFILVAVALVIMIGGRIFAQDGGSGVNTNDDGTQTGGGGGSFDAADNNAINWQVGGDTQPVKMPELNNNYVNTDTRSTTFDEGSECSVANLDCFTKNYQSSQVMSYMGLAVGREADGTAVQADGALQGVSKMVAWTFQPQASGAYYVADALQNIGVVSPTYAQGFGYYSLSPYLKLWRIFRNIAYIFFTLVIVGIGFMILLRQKAGGQAAVTAQQALPRIILALILVTFSYAIAGFLIDVMYWIMYAFTFFINFNGNSGLFGGNVNSANVLVNGDFGVVFRMVATGNLGSIFSSVNETTTNLLGSFWGTGLVTDIIGGLAGLIGTFIIVIALIVNLFRLLFILLKSYAIVLLNIIFAPLSLTMVAFNGTKAFQKWFMSIVANLSPFLITFFMLVVVGTLNAFFNVNSGVAGAEGPIYSDNAGKVNAQGFTPPYLVGTNGTDAMANLGTIIGLAICLAIPELVTNIKKKLGGDGGMFAQVATDAGKNFEKARKGKVAKTVGGTAAGIGLATAGGVKSGISNMLSQRGSGTGGRNFITGFVNYQRQTGGGRVAAGATGGPQAAWQAGPAATRSQYKKLKQQKQQAKINAISASKNPGISARQKAQFTKQGWAARSWLKKYKSYTTWKQAGAPTV